MNRTGLLIVLAVAVTGGLVFGLWPQLDLAISRQFYNDVTHVFGPTPPVYDTLRDIASWIIALLVAPGIIAVIVKLAWPRRRMLVPPRAALFLVATLAIGPGLVTNTILKDYWGRTRPNGITQFGGDGPFVAWWDTRGGCYNNCSFVSGEPSGGFWAVAPAALAPPQWRPVAYSAAVIFGLGLGFLRVAAGGHFASDVLFAGVFMFIVVWIGHGLIYRWARTRLSDDDLEAWLFRRGIALARNMRWLVHRVADEIAGPKAGDETDSSSGDGSANRKSGEGPR